MLVSGTRRIVRVDRLLEGQRVEKETCEACFWERMCAPKCVFWMFEDQIAATVAGMWGVRRSPQPQITRMSEMA